MERKSIMYGVRVATVTGIFGAGFLCGSLSQHSAQAQMGELGGQVLEKAAGSGGALGSVAQLGTTISDMEKHLSALQKNVDVLKKIKGALGH